MRRLGLVVLALLAVCAVAFAGPLPSQQLLNPYETFLWTSPNDTGAQAPDAISLLGLGVSAGEQITLTGFGNMCYMGGPSGCSGLMAAEIAGVFSTSSTFNGPGDSGLLIPGQIALNGTETAATNVNPYYGTWGTGTSAPNYGLDDFAITNTCTSYPSGSCTSVTITVPTGATWLFLGVIDSYYSDNNLPSEGSIGVEIAAVPVTTPEPSASVLLLVGLGSLAASRRFWFR